MARVALTLLPDMLKRSLISHPKYGNIEITRNPRARRIILRARHNVLCITLPTIATEKDLQRALDAHGDKLLAQQEAVQRPVINRDFSINAPHFAFELQIHDGAKFFIKRTGKINTLFCPADTDFANATRQEWLREVIKKSMRQQAKDFLPQRLEQLSTLHGLRYRNMSLRDSHTRWGSCSSRGNISLSIYLMLLPDELIDYVLLHELCHTVELNHSNRFWDKLNSLTDGNALKLRHALRQHRCEL